MRASTMPKAASESTNKWQCFFILNKYTLRLTVQLVGCTQKNKLTKTLFSDCKVYLQNYGNYVVRAFNLAQLLTWEFHTVICKHYMWLHQITISCCIFWNMNKKPFLAAFSNGRLTKYADVSAACIGVLVRQYADICLFSTAQYKCPVAEVESEYVHFPVSD